ncbi:MAG: electron transfer flavoprotein subunit beta/FixA family protein [Candidatus Heimdallarchaeota archaeon]
MPFNILVFVKQVPEITDIKVDPETGTLIREGVPSILNPFDEYAVEEGLRIREKHGGEVTVISMGPPQAAEAIRKCLAMGADHGILLTDRAFAGADTWATSLTLAEMARKLKYDLIICGKQAIDGDTAQVGPEIAEHLGIPQITYAQKVELDPERNRATVQRETEDGYEVIEAKLPLLLTAIKGLNEPRIPSLMGIMKAKKKEIQTVTNADLGLDSELIGLNGSPTQVVKVFPPQTRKGGEKTEALEDPSVGVNRIVEFLGKEGYL